MDWAYDDAQVCDADFRSVFRYFPRESTVIRMLANHDWQVEITSLRNETEWSKWIEDELPSIDGNDSGLILLLAKRSGEPGLQDVEKITPDDRIEQCNEENHFISDLKVADTFSTFQEKEQSTSSSAASQIASGRRDVRTVPFSRSMFETITSSFHVHDSIARAVSRTDVPIFTCDKVRMTQPAYVYNCRSSNAWEMDLALTATHFPKIGLTFVILFGCPSSIEKGIRMRLAKVKAEAAHPLLMPGIFAELERKRHTALVEEMGNKLEAVIFELDFKTNGLEGSGGTHSEIRSKEKRDAYLDLAYLRNSLVSWNTQLAKMVQHCRQLNKEEYTTTRGNDVETAGIRMEDSGNWFKKSRDTGLKIESRLISIRDEYDEMIRECTMRVDGMAMSTQWSNGETNVEIALATNRDSRHMKSIALITMIFLPGTFFASMFSMTFFNWSGDSSSPIVSTSLWIYVLITVIFTSLTIGLWYYIVVVRPSRGKAEDEDMAR